MGSVKLWAFGLAALAIVGVVGAGALHYRGLLDERNALQSERDRLTIHAAEMEQARAAYEAQALALSAAMNDMTDAAIEAESEVERLHGLFKKHDLGTLAKGKPGMVERRINRGTARVLGMFEDATAAGDRDGGPAAADHPAGPGAD